MTEQKKVSSNQENPKILKFKKKRQLNVGLIIFGTIFIYLIATIVMYLTKPNVSAYEVREGSLVKDYAYTGLAIRSEMTVVSEGNGFVNYYLADNSKTKVGSMIYTLSESSLEFGENSTETEDESTLDLLSKDEKHDIVLQIQEFNHDFVEDSFSNVYYLKSNISSKLNQKTNENRLNLLYEMINQNMVSGIGTYRAAKDGVVVYYVDGMENLTLDTVTSAHFDHTNYKRTEFTNNMQVQAGEAVYKLVTTDEWYLLIEITEETASALAEKEQVDVTFNKDGKTLRADFEIKEIEGKKILYLKFKDSMIRYANDRYLEVDLVLEDQKGLKIPKTAAVDQEFYVVPKSYLTRGGDTSGYKLMLRTMEEDGNTVDKLVDPTIYYSTDEIIYLSKNEFKKGDILVRTDSNETHSINETRVLRGVFCINKGYAVFKAINILCESDDYYVIENGNSYSVSNYDHIALQSANIKENDVVF